jgi:uncharacterized membrane protein
MAQVTADDWRKGIVLSVTASIIGGASKLAIRKSWILEQQNDSPVENRPEGSNSQNEGEGQNNDNGWDNNSNDGENNSDNSSIGDSHVHSLLPCSGHHAFATGTSNGDDDGDRSVASERIVVLYAEPELAVPRQGTIRTTRMCLKHRCRPLLLRLSGMFGMTILNPLCCVLAMNYASPSILAPLSGLTLVWIVLLSGPVIGEPPSSDQVLAAALIVTGEVVVAVYGDHTNDSEQSVRDVVRRTRVFPVK